jgi:hypothetical protein
VTVTVAVQDAQEDTRPSVSEGASGEDSSVKKATPSSDEVAATEEVQAATPTAPAVDPKSSKARAEFYQKITQASDDGSSSGK